MTHKLYLDAIGSVEYRKELRSLFHVRELTEAHISIGSDLCMDTFEFFVHHTASKVTTTHRSQPRSFSVSDMPPERLAKLRHVGGWAIGKELERCRRFI